jgi:hypothetical protein
MVNEEVKSTYHSNFVDKASYNKVLTSSILGHLHAYSHYISHRLLGQKAGSVLRKN